MISQNNNDFTKQFSQPYSKAWIMNEPVMNAAQSLHSLSKYSRLPSWKALYVKFGESND